MSTPFKICPECGMEHLRTAEVCSDCGVELETAPAAPSPSRPLPPASELARVAAGGPWEMQRLALQLQEAGISSRIDALVPARPDSRHSAAEAARRDPGSGARLALYVLAEDQDPARRLIQDILARDGSGPAVRESETLESCPACGAPISGAASACSDCGLEFVPLEDTCPSCGAVSSREATVCASCGAPAPREGGS